MEYFSKLCRRSPKTSLLTGILQSILQALSLYRYVMVTGDDPVKAVYTLKDYIVHTHAKDGIKLFDKDPEMIYKVVDDALAHLGRAYREVPLGQGSVDFHNYIKALDEVGYKGFLTIEREVGDDPAKDIRDAVGFLKNLTGR